ncbi:MAG: 30S ribosomal protein S18 [Anaerolineae bacterium]|nr:30S ribosomal protein S18 [Anaerolineae bacterium]MDW8070497.1 30S ribosomal protein S18 [Anaerolineae bacterium]
MIDEDELGEGEEEPIEGVDELEAEEAIIAEAAEQPGAAPGARPGMPGFRPRRLVCAFCVDKVKVIDYKDVKLLEAYLDNYGKIKSGRKTGTCAKHQRRLAVAIKRARHLALLPFTASHLSGE